jgi:hypothetical protein
LPSEKTQEDWLRSGDPRLEAWAAHDALVMRDQDLIPDLVTLASKWQPLLRETCTKWPCSELSDEQIDERDAMAAVLDTLIQMKVPVSTDALRNLAPDFGNDVSIVLARLPDDESIPLSFDFYRSPPELYHGVQYVSAALLALHPPAGFAAMLLASIQVRATVMIVLPKSPQGGIIYSGGSCGVPGIFPRKNWPLTGQYALSIDKSEGAILVVDGIDPVYATRKESTRYTGDDCEMVRVGLVPSERRKLIAEMLGITPESLPWTTAFETNIAFKSLGQFDADILALVATEQEKYRATARALFDRQLVGYPDIETSLPELLLELHDDRGPGAVEIPQLSNLPANVKWSTPQW